MKRPSVRFGRSNNNARTTSRHSLWVADCFCSALVCVRDQHPIDHAVPYSCYCNSTRATSESYSSVSTVHRPAVRRSASIGVFVTTVLRFCKAFYWDRISEGYDVGWSFCSFLLNSDVAFENFRTNRQNTCQTLKGPLSSVSGKVSLGSRTAAVVAVESSSRPGCIACPRWLVVLPKKEHVLSFNTIPESNSSIDTYRRCTVCMLEFFEKPMTSMRYERADYYLTNDSRTSIARWNVVGASPGRTASTQIRAVLRDSQTLILISCFCQSQCASIQN